MNSAHLPAAFDGFTLLFISDFQFDTVKRFNTRAMKNIISKANQQKADMLVLGGDYVNRTGFRDEFYPLLDSLNIPASGGYAILGNHDYHDPQATAARLEALGYRVLHNSNAKVKSRGAAGGEADYIHIAGTADLWFGKPDFGEAVKGLRKEDFIIFLTHNPDYFLDYMPQEEKEYADITLAGHTHAGQVTFFGLFGITPISLKNSFTYRCGMKRSEGAPIYITSGVGGSVFGHYIRFFARPEIVLLELKREEPPSPAE